MTSRQAVQGHPQLDPYHLSRGHHKRCSCEPYFAQAGAFTGSLRQQHLGGKGTTHSVALSWRTCLVHFLCSSSIFCSLSTISDHHIDDLSSRYCKTCPTALKLTPHFLEDLVSIYVYLNRYKGLGII